eukprot:CAMPEP_0181185822 /NCGR_PEP_ID=MMETSP1096-20121128/9712_1 /TAXON_ID=156174 ORGANISM="Chrysochromulina ericina, Strain CCMP281" /NCGR_SAMPLE_ID=MMETSP1096 /ASSEMBLY_ACC=CAM_ASM_000453 /LENGTH=81 /DNA_ID=CAMNT_0023274691 /DNA_START=429 /DNA_END=675 /DNA_ORIENTATION=-
MSASPPGASQRHEAAGGQQPECAEVVTTLCPVDITAEEYGRPDPRVKRHAAQHQPQPPVPRRAADDPRMMEARTMGGDIGE